MKTKETSKETSTREQALAWWNNLPLHGENSQFRLVTKHLGDSRFPKSLTGKEIEEIWRKEVGDLKLHKGEIVDKSYPKEFQDAYLKPNQKVFKEFDESKFRAYINKFSDEDKYNAFWILFESLTKVILKRQEDILKMS